MSSVLRLQTVLGCESAAARLALWPTWLHVAEEGSEPLDDGPLSMEKVGVLPAVGISGRHAVH